MFPGLYELDISDNPSVKVDKLLEQVQCGALTNLVELHAVNCSALNKTLRPLAATLEDGLFLLNRLDLSGSLTK